VQNSYKHSKKIISFVFDVLLLFISLVFFIKNYIVVVIMNGCTSKHHGSKAIRGCGRTWKISQARSMRLAKSEEELPGESTVEAMGARSRCPDVRREGPAKGFRRLPGGVGRQGHGVRAAPWAPQLVAGVCIACTRRGSGAAPRVGEGKGGAEGGRTAGEPLVPWSTGSNDRAIAKYYAGPAVFVPSASATPRRNGNGREELIVDLACGLWVCGVLWSCGDRDRKQQARVCSSASGLLHCIHRRRVPSIGGTVFRSFAQRLLSHTQARPSSDVTARPRYR